MTPTENHLPATWGRTLTVWWAFMWRVLLINLGYQGFTYGVSGISKALDIDCKPDCLLTVIYTVICIIAFEIVDIWIYTKILKKQFPTFKVALLSKSVSDVLEYLPVTWARAIAFWWAITWRSFLLSILIFGILIAPFFMIWATISNFGEMQIETIIKSQIAFFILSGILAHLSIFKRILRKGLRKFRVVLVENIKNSPITENAELQYAL